MMNNLSRLLMRIPVPWAFVLSYLIGVCLEYWAPLRRWDWAASNVGVAGYALLGLGVGIAGWSLVLFYRLGTTTVPGRTSSKLVTWGPYRFSRNPMYVGLVLVYLGEAGILRQLWPTLLLPFIVAYLNWVVIPVEEGRLREAFGADYEEYRARVRRWI